MIPLNEHLAPLKRSAIRVYTNLANETEGCVKLTIGEPDLDTPKPVKQAAMEALKHNRTHYAPNQGTQELRRAIARYESRRGHIITPEQVLVTIGEVLVRMGIDVLNRPWFSWVVGLITQYLVGVPLFLLMFRIKQFFFLPINQLVLA